MDNINKQSSDLNTTNVDLSCETKKYDDPSRSTYEIKDKNFEKENSEVINLSKKTMESTDETDLSQISTVDSINDNKEEASLDLSLKGLKNEESMEFETPKNVVGIITILDDEDSQKSNDLTNLKAKEEDPRISPKINGNKDLNINENSCDSSTSSNNLIIDHQELTQTTKNSPIRDENETNPVKLNSLTNNSDFPINLVASENVNILKRKLSICENGDNLEDEHKSPERKIFHLDEISSKSLDAVKDFTKKSLNIEENTISSPLEQQKDLFSRNFQEEFSKNPNNEVVDLTVDQNEIPILENEENFNKDRDDAGGGSTNLSNDANDYIQNVENSNKNILLKGLLSSEDYTNDTLNNFSSIPENLSKNTTNVEETSKCIKVEENITDNEDWKYNKSTFSEPSRHSNEEVTNESHLDLKKDTSVISSKNFIKSPSHFSTSVPTINSADSTMDLTTTSSNKYFASTIVPTIKSDDLSQDLTSSSIKIPSSSTTDFLTSSEKPLTSKLDFDAPILNFSSNAKNLASQKQLSNFSSANIDFSNPVPVNLKKPNKNFNSSNKSSRSEKKLMPYAKSTKRSVKTSINNKKSPKKLKNFKNYPQIQNQLKPQIIPPIIPPIYELSQSLKKHIEYKCSKCFNSNFKNIRELENHQKYCLLYHNNDITSTTALIPTSYMHPLTNTLSNSEIFANSNLNENQNLKDLLSKPAYNILDKPIEISGNLTHYLTQVEQKHKSILHQNYNTYDPTRSLFGNDPQLHQLNHNIYQEPIMQTMPSYFCNETNIQNRLNFEKFQAKNMNFQQAMTTNTSLDLEPFSSTKLDLALRNPNISNAPLTLNQPPPSIPLFTAATNSFEPILSKFQQDQISTILPPDHLLNKYTSSSAAAVNKTLLNQNQFYGQMSTSSNENQIDRINKKDISPNFNSAESFEKISSQYQSQNILEKTLQNPEKTLQNKNQDIIKPDTLSNQPNTSSVNSSVNQKQAKKLFLCNSCGSYHQNWSLFLHMHEMHKKYICLICLRMFPTAEHLTVHLEMKHDIEQNHFESQEKLMRSTTDSCYLMCCTCEHIFTEHDDFYQHSCPNYLKPCSLCGLLGKHMQNCKANLEFGSEKKKRNKKLTQKSKINNANKNSDQNCKNTNNSVNESIQENNMQSQFTSAVCDNINENNKNKIEHTSAATTEKIDDYDSNNDSDSDSPNKYNGYLEHFNYNDNDLINLYKSNRLANLAKQKEKEDSEVKSNYDTSESVENIEMNSSQLDITNSGTGSILQSRLISTEDNDLYKNTTTFSDQDVLNNESTENEENKLVVPKLKLKISKELLNQSQKLVESEESSTESSVDDDNNDERNESESENVLNDNSLEKLQNNNNNIDNKIIYPDNQQESCQEACKVLDENSDVIEEDSKVLNDSKNDSDMDIDVTCNQGVVHLQPEQKQELSEKISDPIQSVNKDSNFTQLKDFDDSSEMQVDETPPSSVLPSAQNLQNDIQPEQAPQQFDDTLSKPEENSPQGNISPEIPLTPIKKIPTDGIELADDDVQILDLTLDSPLDKIPMIALLRTMLKSTFPLCLYCNHARRIAVNGNSLALHMLSQHRFSATVDSITAEELLPSTIVAKLKSYLEDLDSFYFNLESYCNLDRDLFTIEPNVDEKLFECFACRFSSSIHKELYMHNRKMHLRTAILCFMCRSNFYSYSEILCHICPGAQHKVILFDIKFRCCLCELDQIPSAFRLMVHLRKAHFTCDVCLENCFDQTRLSSHVWKHKLHHLCYRCGIAYRNKPDITKHLFWKHGTESVLCKRCLQKRWPHVYHFCIPPITFVCETCNISFTRAMYLKVHKRLHCGDAPYPCSEDNCDKKFISRKLLLKHVKEHQEFLVEQKPLIDSEMSCTIKEDTESVLETKEGMENKVLNDKTLKTEEKNDVKEEEGQVIKKKKKKSKRNTEKENLDDLNLQVPNLSESGSSDESDSEKPIKPVVQEPGYVPNVMLSPPSEQEDDEEIKTETNPEKVTDIWNNFKTFQANQTKTDEDEQDDENTEPLKPILHVSQSDHDYCRMHKYIVPPKKKDEKSEDDKQTKKFDGIGEFQRSLLLSNSTSKKKQKSPKKSHAKSGSDSSSSSSSSSDSSCSCNSTCSCSSSSNSSSDSSSSSDDSDSSSSKGKRRIAAKRAAKDKKRRNRLKSENSSKANNSDIVDVVTTDTKLQPTNLEPIIYEVDLETEESDTDEDFYDEHPQKLASELLAEKRRQLMQQTCMSPSHNFDIVENSRPSTPSLPEEMMFGNSKEKKVKVKKKKRERKASNKNAIPPFKLSIPKSKKNLLPSKIDDVTFIQPLHPLSQPAVGSVHLPVDSFISPGVIDLLPPANLMAASTPESSHAILTPPLQATSSLYQSGSIIGSSHLPILNLPVNTVQQNMSLISTPASILNPSVTSHSYGSFSNTPVAAPINSLNRHSTESSSDASAVTGNDGSLKRSKRARRPNRFYGYSSDDESTIQNPLISPGGVFKPTPPPNLTWRKEDLPSPPKNILFTKNHKSPLITSSKTTPLSSFKKSKFFKKKENSTKKDGKFGSRLFKSGGDILPPIPPLKIRPSDILPQVPPSILDHQPTDGYRGQSIAQPPVVEPIRVPPVPVHHIEPSQFYPSSKDSVDSDSESDEDKLTIPIKPYDSKPIKSGKSSHTKTGTPKVKSSKSKIKSFSTGARTSYNVAPSKSSINSILPAIETAPPPPPPKEKKIPPALLPNPDLITLQYFKRNNIRYPIRPPAGARAPREGESVYCYCRCPYDEVSEMIACDGDECMIEWFHFECVGILFAPQGKWFCAECKPLQQHHSSQHSYGGTQTSIGGFSASTSSNSSFGASSGSIGY